MIIGQPYSPFKLFTGSFIPNWLLSRKDLSGSAKLVWARLAQYSGKNGIAWPHQETLAEEVGMDVRTVRRALKDLEKACLIYVQSPEGVERLTHGGNKYRFVWTGTEVDEPETEPEKNTEVSQNEPNLGACPKGALLPSPKDTILPSPKDTILPSPIYEENHNGEENHNDEENQISPNPEILFSERTGRRVSKHQEFLREKDRRLETHLQDSGKKMEDLRPKELYDLVEQIGSALRDEWLAAGMELGNFLPFGG